MLALVAGAAATLATFVAAGQLTPAPSAPPAGTADAGPAGDVNGCVESVPKGSQRPSLTETLPARGTSGWAATLSITVMHGKGERVLPAGLDLSSAVEAKKVLRKAGFAIPDQDGGAGAHVWSEKDDPSRSVAITHLDLPLVLLPEKPGRNVMQLPPLPVAVARANGEIATVCTHPHTIVVEDPIASTPAPEPKPNPPPRPQIEEWTALKKGLLYGLIGVLVGAILAYAGYKIVTKPKPPPPPPPPRPPWEIALEKLDEVRHAGLLESKRHAEYFDRVSDAVRGYLGARFGFDGLESTTDEILAALKKQGAGFVRFETQGPADLAGAPTPGIPLKEIQDFLFECDLVKFANLKPTPDQCSKALTEGETIVRGTMPFFSPGKPAAIEEPKESVPAESAPVDASAETDAKYMPPAPSTTAADPPKGEAKADDAPKGGDA
ncbi:MAG: hypothetical protein JST00_09225 [Deltaproteobacteria bacterium]|nr:hypothetical protein [Deltaproteobacteria bacterium]